MIARWFEARLAESLEARLVAPRLYGLELIDPDAVEYLGAIAYRVAFLGEHEDAIDVEHRLGERSLDFDAAALVTSEWAVASDRGVMRPGAYDQRRRARVVTLVCGTGAATALRWEHEPTRVVLAPGLAASCPAGAALARRWMGT